MIGHCGPVAKTILVLLLIESIVAWAIILSRLAYLRRASRLNAHFRRTTAGAIKDYESIEVQVEDAPLAQLATIAASEHARILSAQTKAVVGDVARFFSDQRGMAAHKLDAAILSLSSKIERGAFFLAITSSSAPFLGLLGTVWGIMDSFFEIGKQGSASLPTVAPGIAEALISTVIGLAVAIPAVFFYNILLQKIQKMQDEMLEFKEDLLYRLKQESFAYIYPESA